MQTRLLGLTAALAAAAITSGCGLTGTQPTEPSKRSGEITVVDKSVHTQSVKCTQDQWALSIEATTNPGRARAYLHDPEPLAMRTASFVRLEVPSCRLYIR